MSIFWWGHFCPLSTSGIKLWWSRTQANRRTHLAILASTSFYGDRMEEQALDKPADGFLQFSLHLHTFERETTDWWSTQIHNKKYEILVIFSAAESSGFTRCRFISDKQGKQKVWLLMLLRLVVRPQFTSQITQDNI